MVNRRWFMLAAGILLLASAVFAQTGGIDGMVMQPGPNPSGMGVPAVGATVTAYITGHDTLTATTDSLGHFAFTALAAGEYHLRCAVTGFLAAEGMARVRDAHTEHVTLFLRPIPTGFGRVEGLVFLPDHRTRAVGATVVLFRGVGDSLQTMTDDSGHYGFDSARVGRHDIKTYLTGYNLTRGEVEVMDGRTSYFNFVLLAIPTGIGRVEGLVFLPNRGGRAVGATVVLFRAAGDSLTTATDDSGHFAFDNARVGNHDIKAYMAGYGLTRGHVNVMDGRTSYVNLELLPLPVGYGWITGTVTLPDSSHSPAVGALVTLYKRTGDSLMATADATGAFRFDTLAVGEYRFSVTLTGYRAARGEVRVRDGYASVLRIRLRPVPVPPVYGSVAGLVTQADATPVAGAFISIFGNGMRSHFEGRSDSLGHFNFARIPIGNWTIAAHTRLLGSATAQITVTEAQVTSITLVLAADSSHGGRFDDVSSSPEVPVTYFTAKNYPNPFNPVTTISYSIPSASQVKLAVFDITGRLIAELVNGYQAAGSYRTEFDGRSLPSGMYFYRLTAGSLTNTGRMMLLK